MKKNKSKIKVAIASDFFTSFSKVPRKQQAKVLDFINKFRSDPMLPGINYERIVCAKDPNMRSVRIDQSYRGIVLKPESGNVYVLLWVDHHDEAYRWAENKTYQIHPETGSLQVIDVEAGDPSQVIAESQSDDGEKGLFDDVRDRHLLKLGVPEQQLQVVRGVRDESDLDRLAGQIPQEAYESLFFIASGYSLEDVFQEIEASEAKKPVDTEDFGAALENPDSRRRFYVVEDDLELAAMLNAPLEKWRVFLHPSQQKLVERSWNGPVRVLGGAGTGKTVAAIHRAKWLAQHLFNDENDRILFTTFTRNLAADIQDNLSKICSKDVLRRIEVANLDRWVATFLRRNGYEYEIDYGNRTDQLWKQAVDMAPDGLNLEPSFYREEWERVVQPQAISSANEYMQASRIGRGIRLNRKARKSVWSVFEEYWALLNENGLREPADAMQDARLLLANKNEDLPYRAIVVDEAQDMGIQAFSLIRQMVPEGKNDLFIVGDAHQRIYRHKVVLGQCGINIVGRSRKLKINYRTTDETRAWAISLLKGLSIDDLDGGTDDQKGYKSLLHGVYPEVKIFSGFKEEVDFIADYLNTIKTDTGVLNGICLVARTNNLLMQYQNSLKEKDIDVYMVKRSEAEDRQAPGVRLGTMHRVKGLEFDHVIIAGVNDGIIPLESIGARSSDPTVKVDSEISERALLYVSATRAKKAVVVTAFGKASRFII
ncbi:UvrD/REP helicase [Desulfosarcina cetonica]|uniref:UvrD-helicase domain-containing protein n=1 Tax=Desulfosarcina cetonica TaxID=90730 RepID=UPI0006D25418|nr:UvrD-helicase domain-containing protein [Desulfosarcina cetonica]VTR68338.1 UvrD/REP helicase [Desulfosarcina cetonica]